MRRRGYIAHGGALVAIAVAGCSSGDGDGTPTDDGTTAGTGTADTDTPTGTATTADGLFERPAEDLLLRREQLSDEWAFAEEDLDGQRVERLFRRDSETLLYSYARTFDSVEAATSSYEDHMETLGRSTEVQSVDLEGADDAAGYVRSDRWLQFIDRNVRGAIRHSGPDATEADVVGYAELMLEHV